MKKYPIELKGRLIADPRFQLLGNWKDNETGSLKRLEISENGGRFFIFIYEWSNDTDDFLNEPKLYPLHYDKFNDVFYFFNDGKRTELLPDADDMENLTVFPLDFYTRVENTHEAHSCHITEV